MAFPVNRRFVVAAAAVLLAFGAAMPAQAQAPANLRFSAVFSEQDIRAEMMKRFGEDIKAVGFTLQPYYGGTLFKQGTELVAMQRGNLEMGNIAPERELADFFKAQGLEVYTPDIKAFREFAQKKYLASDLAKSWPAGMLDKINAM